MILHQQLIFTTFALSFGLLHSVLFLYNRRSKSNLYFSLFAFMYAANIFFDFQALLHRGELEEFLFLQIHRVVLPYSTIFLALFVYCNFEIKTPKYFWVIAGGLALSGIYAGFEPVENFLYFQIFLIAIFIEAVRLLILGFRKKADGGGDPCFWICFANPVLFL